MRISRPCYDKYHRCPGWAGGGMKYAKVQGCDGGYITYPQYDVRGKYDYRLKRTWKWRLNKCPKCGVIVLPSVIRWIDWGWLSWKIPFEYRNWRRPRENR